VQRLRHTLLETHSNLASAWRLVFGSAPETVHLLVNTRRATREDLAQTLALLRYNYLSLKNHPELVHQIRRAVTQKLPGEPRVEYRHGGYVRTHRSLVEAEEMSTATAAAHALRMHDGETPSQQEDALDVHTTPPSTANHLALPSKYLGVNRRGGLVLLDAQRGASAVELAGDVPTNWLLRVRPDHNHFLAGDDTRAMFITLDDTLTTGFQKPVALPRYPPGPAHGVDHTMVVWHEPGEPPLALEWNAEHETADPCPPTKSRVSHMSIRTMHARGNEVWCDQVCITRLPAGECITAVTGSPTAVDVFTAAGDWWRVDVRGGCAWVVGVPTDAEILVVASLLEWV